MFDENGEPIAEDPWASIVDLMSALVLVLFLAVIFFVTNYSEVSEELTLEKQNLAERSADLERTRIALEDSNNARLALAERERLLLAQTENLKRDRAQLLAETERLEAERSLLSSETERLERERVALTTQTERLTADRVALTAQTERLIADRTSLTARAERLEEERLALTAQTEQLRSDKVALTTRTELLNGERVSLTAETEDLRSQRAALIAEKEKLERDRTSLTSQLDAEKLKLQQERVAFDADKKRLLGDKSALSSETERLNAQVLRLQAALREAAERQAGMMTSLAESFEQARAEGVSVDREGGKIILKSEVLFSKGQADLTEGGRESLKSVSIGLMKVLSDPKLRESVEGVMIEGHTSSSGAFERNLHLSSERSLNTLEFMLQLPEFKNADPRVRQLFFAGAFGPSRPVLVRGKEDPKKSRRIEIRVLFNQTQVKSLADVITR